MTEQISTNTSRAPQHEKVFRESQKYSKKKMPLSPAFSLFATPFMALLVHRRHFDCVELGL